MLMPFEFDYQGGVRKYPFYPSHRILDGTRTAAEKFLLFLIYEGQEIPFFHAFDFKAMGLAQRRLINLSNLSSAKRKSYITSCEYLKLFMSLKGSRSAALSYSFYLRIINEEKHPVSEIIPFSCAFYSERSNLYSEIDQPLNDCYLEGKFSFLKKEQVRELMAGNSIALAYLEKQAMLPIETIKKIVKVRKWTPPGMEMRLLRFT